MREKFKNLFISNFPKSCRLAYELFKIMIPIIIIVKILEELNLVAYIGEMLSPLMNLVGLPGEMGLVLAASIISNLYAAMVVFYELYEKNPDLLTTAHVNILGSMILLAHNYLIELRVAQRIGVRLRFLIVWKSLACFVLGFWLHKCFSFFGLFQEPLKIQWAPEPTKVLTYPEWVLGELLTLVIVFVIIYVLLVTLDFLKLIGFNEVLSKALIPILKMIGVSKNARDAMIIGLLVGFSYGGALMIEQVEKDSFSVKDLLGTVLFLSLSHAILEDTILILLLKANFSIIFIVRILFSVAFVWITMWVLNLFHEKHVKKFLLR